jgi:two-component system, NtrC family, sensor kinase
LWRPLCWAMPETESELGRWKRLTHSLSAKLISLLLLVMTGIFGLLGYLNIHLHRQHLEAATLTSAERVSDVIRRSTSYYMLRNDREGMYHAMATMADEPGMVRVRIFDQQGRISYSSDTSEIGHSVDQSAEACYGCHVQSQPLTRLDRPDRFRIYRDNKGQRVLGVITPIENQPGCSNADCHAHPAGQQVLGVLDANLSLAKADAQLAQTTRRMLAYTLFALLDISLLSWFFVWRLVGQPLKCLTTGTKELADGNLGYQLAVDSSDEAGELATSFNRMSLQLQSANGEIVAWAKTLEDRVDEKTRELKRAHEQVLHVEKMATIGKMAAVVAHEINNPLSGILTYAKLIRKWIERGETQASKKGEAEQCLTLIAEESRRCGELVKNLLTFSRTAPMNVQATDLTTVADRSVRLIAHQLKLNGIELHTNLPKDLPHIPCDPGQIEQVLLALMMNAIDAMPRGGNLWLSLGVAANAAEIAIEVRDDGSGIPADILPNIFEPFVTTKEGGKSVGLGLAVSQNILERHGGRIEVESAPGKGTTFTVTLPVESSGMPLVAALGEATKTKSR